MSVTFPGPSILRDIQGDDDQQNWRLRNAMPQVPPPGYVAGGGVRIWICGLRNAQKKELVVY